MLLIEIENATVTTLSDSGEIVDQFVYEHTAINIAALNSINDNYPHGCVIVLNGDRCAYWTQESYATILEKIKDAEDEYYFRNYVIKPLEKKQEDKEHE